MRIYLSTVLFACIFQLSGDFVRAQQPPLTVGQMLSPNEIASKLDTQFRSKIVILRVPVSASLLKFDAYGNAMERNEPGPWTLYGRIQIDRVEMKRDSTLVLVGKRVFVSFDDSQQQRLIRNDQNVRMEIQFGSAPQMADVSTALRRMFLSSGEKFPSILPAYWQAFFAKRSNNAANSNSQDSTASANLFQSLERSVRRVGNDVTAPRAIFTPDPHYEEIARSYRKEGRTVLWCVVDENGTARDIQVVKALGLGLDDRAVETIAKWKFLPATEHGAAVPVQINVEVNFRLFR